MPRILLLLLLLLFPVYCFAQEKYSYKYADTLKLANRKAIIPMPDGDMLDGIIVLDTTTTAPQPTVLIYSIYNGSNEIRRARMAAMYGYASIIVYTRGKGISKSTADPFRHDSDDAWHVLEWISNQPWCNKKIGMYGGSYLGFSQWAAAKSGHPALKTIVPQVAVGPGIDFPARNGVFMNYALSWIQYVSNTKQLDEDAFHGKKTWEANRNWFRNGYAYRKLDSIYGAKNKVFAEWLDNPSYTDYWQKMVPYKQEFAKIEIPVLTTTGYYDVDQTGALHYYNEHLKHNPGAEHYLVIGPYSHPGAQGIPTKELLGYNIDETAQINIYNLVFEWMDYILKDGKKPEFLRDKVNYQVMDANVWKHASSLSAMNNDTLKFYFTPQKLKKGRLLLSAEKPAEGKIPMEIDFKNRKENFHLRSNYSKIKSKRLNTNTRLEFVSDPITESMAINGNFTGELAATINKKDIDIIVELYELKADGEYFDLSHYLGRASYAKDIEKRQLLVPGMREKIPFTRTMFTSKKIEKGSRLVVCITVNRDMAWQTNYGTGKDVSDETIEDAGEPLKILWHTDSFIKIPVLKENKKPLN